jgi:hypothetical protein
VFVIDVVLKAAILFLQIVRICFVSLEQN